MKAAFDDTALAYDTEFTHTPIGKLQRESVWDYLSETFKGNFPKNVLELNCGTGEDAIFFAQRLSNVVATDISEKMLNVTMNKVRMHGLEDVITTKRLDMRQIGNETFDRKFDLIFSNFGGLNCIDPANLSTLFERLAGLLNPGGRMILVVMPRFCAWESFYFLTKLNTQKAFRRSKKAVQPASLGNAVIDVWYYNPSRLQKMANAYFKIVHTQPIGIAVPPSYFKNTFLSRERILKNLDAAEKKLNKFKLLAGFSDHYLIDMELR